MTAQACVGDYMTVDLVLLTPEIEILHAMNILLENRISGAAVVDGEGELVGVLSKKDCLRAALNGAYFQEWGGQVATYMSRNPETLEADLDLVSAAEWFLKSDYRRFPVLRHGKLVGQISRSDILSALLDHWSA